MKQPNLNNLTIDRAGTRKLRAQMQNTKKIKITIDIDAQRLTLVRKVSGKSSIPYQQILSQVLKETAIEKGEARSRLDRIEKEIEKLKRQIAA
jgi:predicted DNA binding CopG/RHH family protein